MPLFQSFNNRERIKQGAATGVDQHDAGFHFLQRTPINHVFVLRCERAMPRDDVRLREQLIGFHVTHAEGSAGGVGNWIERQSWATDSGEDLRHHIPNLSRADHAHCFAVHVNPSKPSRAKLPSRTRLYARCSFRLSASIRATVCSATA